MSRDRDAMSVGDYLASVPYTLGWQPGDEHLVVGVVYSDGQVGPLAAMHWPAGRTTRDAAEALAAGAVRIAAVSDARRLVVIGYGPAGDERSAAVADAILGSADVDTPVTATVRGDVWQAMLPDGRWIEPRPLPPAAWAVAAGLPAPAATREAAAERVQPLPQPLFESGVLMTPFSETTFAASSPVSQATAARHYLNELAEPAGEQRTFAMRVVAAAANAYPEVRDDLLIYASGDPARLDALVRVYQASPPDARPGVATTAAAAACVGGQPTHVVQTILKHADHTGPNARLTQLIALTADAHIDGRALRGALEPGAASALIDAEHAWQREVGDTVRTHAAMTKGRHTTRSSAAQEPQPASRPTHRVGLELS